MTVIRIRILQLRENTVTFQKLETWRRGRFWSRDREPLQNWEGLAIVLYEPLTFFGGPAVKELTSWQ